MTETPSVIFVETVRDRLTDLGERLAALWRHL